MFKPPESSTQKSDHSLDHSPDHYALGISSALLAAFSWGTTGIFVRLLEGWSPAAVVGWRFVVALLGMIVLLALRGRLFNLPRTMVRWQAWVLSLLMVGYYLCATRAFQLASVAEITLFVSTSPLFVMAWRFATRQSVPLIELAGSVLAMGGVALVLAPKLLDAQSGSFATGWLLAFCSAAIRAAYSIIYQRASARNDAPRSDHVALMTFALGSALLAVWIGLVIGGSFSGETVSASYSFADPLNYFYLAGLALLSTILPTIAYSTASQHLSSILTTSVVLLTPVVGTALAALILSQSITIWIASGGGLVLAGLWLMTASPWVRRARRIGMR